MTHEKILDRIRKLLSMAADTSSPNEAAIAAKRARHLMDEHQVSDWDLKQARPEDFGEAGTMYAERWHGMLGIAMAWLNDVNVALVEGKRGKPVMRFQGYLVDAVTAKELWLYLVAQAEAQAKATPGKKAPYKHGFAVGVQRQVKEMLKEREQIKTSNGTALVVAKRNLVEERYGKMNITSGRQRHSGANYEKGVADGMKAGLNRQVGGTSGCGLLE